MNQKKEKVYEIKDHQLYTAKYSVLFKLFTDNKTSSKKRWLIMKIFFWATLVQPFILLQNLIYGRRIAKMQVESPVFIIGQWRSGTTHLHYLISKDPNLGTMTNFVNFMFNISLIGKGWLDYILMPLMPDKRPMDNIRMTMYSPQEEEPASGTITACTGVHAMFFPKNPKYFEKFMLFKNISPKEKLQWQKAYQKIMKTVAYINKGKRVLMKGPFNSSRVKELLELYPDAKFIYIHRNPFQVYNSTRKLYKTNVESQMLQDMSEQDIQDMIFDIYKRLLEKYIRERALIPEGNLVEISYEELDQMPIETVEKIYKVLNLPDYNKALPHFQEYLDSVKNYKTNKFKDISPEIEKRILEEWGFSFEEWGYDKIKA